MAENVPARTTLSEFSAPFDAKRAPVAIRELAFLGQFALRSRVPEALAKTIAVLGGDDPSPGTYELTDSGQRVLWARPDERIVVCSPEQSDAVETRLRQGLEPGVWALDVSCHRAVLEIEGGPVDDLLAQGTSVTLHDRSTRLCVATTVARTSVTIVRVDDPLDHSAQLFCRSSYAPYLARWLLDAIDGLEDKP